MFARIIALFALCCSAALAAPAIDASARASAGSQIAIKVSGSANPRDFITIVVKGSPEGSYTAYAYVDKPAVQLTAPPKPGEYELRVLGANSPYPTLARKAILIEKVVATLTAPAQVPAGKSFQVQWTGPANAGDYIGIGTVDVKQRPYITYEYARSSPITLRAPDQAGEYELRYFLGAGDEIIGNERIAVGSVSASVQAPTQVAAGAAFQINWQGPNNAQDYITLVPADAPSGSFNTYEYTARGNPVQLRAPDRPGAYEVRYLTGQSNATLASAPITVTAITASLQAPAEAPASTAIAVKWQGPNNPQDYITIVRKGAREGETGHYTYTSRGNPASVLAPLEAGEYELRYATGQSSTTLARQPIRIVPGKQDPGFLRVTGGANASPGAIEIILDASGSMLQKLGTQRRIDIAKQTLVRLTSTVIPANRPFALRVFGREVDSCQTDLEIPVSPLNAAQISAKINALVAKNNAKTPIGASLDKVADDLKSVRGERLVIVLTDGEETCGGDPAAAIQRLQAAGTTVRVSIVGFAIDDPKLAATFQRWADLGKGSFFNAKDAAGLNEAMNRALRPTFEVLDAKGQVIAEGSVDAEPVKVPAGTLSVRLKGAAAPAKAVAVKPTETTTVSL